MSSNGRRRGEHDARDDQPYEDPTLDPSESLVTDDLSADPLDVGVIPPNHYSAAERFGTTAAEARRGESLDQLLAEEEPELEPAFPGRAVACWLPRDATPSPPSRRRAHTAAATTNDSSTSSSHEEGVMPTHKGGTA